MDFIHEIRTYKDDFPVWTSTYRNMGFAPHWHNELELLYVWEGHCEIVVDDKPYTLQAGDMIMYGACSPHYCQHTENTENLLEFVLIDPQFLDEAHITIDETLHIPTRILQAFSLRESLLEWLSTVRTELEQRRPYYQELIRSAFTKFWYTMQRELYKEKSLLQGNSKMKKLKRALQYIHEHYAEELSLETVADVVQITPTYFSEMFRKLMGVNYVQYLQNFRINKALLELKKGEKRILDVAFDVGFTNIRSFNRVFQQQTGMTPTQFLKSPDKDNFYVKMSLNPSAAIWQVENDSFVVWNTPKNSEN